MRRILAALLGIVAATAAFAAPPAASAPESAPPLDRAAIERLTGLTGTWNESERVFKVSAPRTDAVQVDGWALSPFLGLTSWAAFAPGHGGAMVMGDLVLLGDEIDAAMRTALDNGLDVTALHNHFLYDEPRVFFMHVGGHGDTAALATAVGKTLTAVRAVRQSHPEVAARFGPAPPANAIHGAPLEAILGQKAQTKEGMAKFVFGRAVAMDGASIGAEMGVNTWFAFGGGDDDAVVDGDFAVRETELRPVLVALCGAGIHVVAIHHHMVGETPRTLFLHFWGRGPAAGLARALQAARTLTAER